MNAARLLPTLLLALVLTAACATVVPPVPQPAAPAPTAPPTNPAAHGTVNVYVTFYGGPDNDPPGSTDIAYPNGRHGAAAGTGSSTAGAVRGGRFGGAHLNQIDRDTRVGRRKRCVGPGHSRTDDGQTGRYT